ncbi:MAG: hypothetical protein BGO98_31230 [Myxococcales bacterium 68-20]|nr:MAG: hypothetical protein BGO98_31230 [Myxococcales bacterium 68-20]
MLQNFSSTTPQEPYGRDLRGDRVADVDNHPALTERMPRGKSFAIADGRSFIPQRSSGGHLRIYLALRAAEVATSWRKTILKKRCGHRRWPHG